MLQNSRSEMKMSLKNKNNFMKMYLKDNHLLNVLELNKVSSSIFIINLS